MQATLANSVNNPFGVAFWVGEYIPDTTLIMDSLVEDTFPKLTYIPFSEDTIQLVEKYFVNSFDGGYTPQYLDWHSGLIIRDKTVNGIIAELEQLGLLDLLEPFLFLATQIQTKCATINNPDFMPDSLAFSQQVRERKQEYESLHAFLDRFYTEYLDQSIERESYSDFITSIRVKTTDKEHSFTIADKGLLVMIFKGFINLLGGYSNAPNYDPIWRRKLKGMAGFGNFVEGYMKFPAQLARDLSSMLTDLGKFPAYNLSAGDVLPTNIVPTIVALIEHSGFRMIKISGESNEEVSIDKDNVRNWLTRS